MWLTTLLKYDSKVYKICFCFPCVFSRRSYMRSLSVNDPCSFLKIIGILQLIGFAVILLLRYSHLWGWLALYLLQVQCNVFEGASGEVALTAAGGLRKLPGLIDNYENAALVWCWRTWHRHAQAYTYTCYMLHILYEYTYTCYLLHILYEYTCTCLCERVVDSFCCFVSFALVFHINHRFSFLHCSASSECPI